MQYLDELARATDVSYDGMVELLERYRGTSGMPRARKALYLMDGGSRSADEATVALDPRGRRSAQAADVDSRR